MPPDENAAAGDGGEENQGNAAAASEAAAAADAAAAESQAAADAAAAGGFMAGLSADDAKFAQTKGFDKTGLGGVLKSYRELEAKVGLDTITVPGDDAKPEDLEKFYNLMGRPEEAGGDKGYQFKAADGVEVSEDLDGWFRAAAHKHGLSERAAAGLFTDWNELQQANQATHLEATDQELNALKAEKGAAYAAFEAAAKQAVQAFVPKDEKGEPDGAILDIMEKQLKTIPLFKIWGAIGEQIANLGALDGSGAGMIGIPTTPEAAIAEIKKTQSERDADPKHALNDQRNPGYREAADRWAQLHKIAYPEK